MKILWASESLHFKTGYGGVSRELCERWADKGHEVHSIGWYNIGDPYPHVKKVGNKWSLTNILQHAGEMSIGLSKNFDKENLAAKYLREIQPDVFASLVDIWFSATMASETNKAKTPYINYFPVDGTPFPPDWLMNMKDSDRVLAMSQWGQKIMNEWLNSVYGIKKEIDYIPHGINQKHFYRIDEDIIAKIKKQNGWQDKFIVGFVGKNMSRKMIPRLLKAFAIFHDKHKDSLLVMNIGNPLHSDYGIHLPTLVQQLGLSKDVFFYGNNLTHNNGVPVENLNVLYNLFDVHASATSGEGFGLTTLESQACGTPNIICDFTTAQELVGGHGWLVPPVAFIEGQYGVNRAVVNVPAMADAMSEAYENPELLAKYSKDSEAFARSDAFNWDTIADQFLDLFKKAQDNYVPVEKRYGGKFNKQPKAGFRNKKNLKKP